MDDTGLDDPVSTFLLERRAGHCEYFASGMAVMLRSLGIPARIVNGYQQGTWASWSGSYIVRQRDAHSWVEAWLPGRGWTQFDPTPDDTQVLGPQTGLMRELWRNLQIAWDDHVVGFGASHQARFVATVRDVVADLRLTLAGRGPLIAGVASVLVLLTWAWTRRRAERQSCPVPFYAQLLKRLKDRGQVPREGQTAREFAGQVAAELGAEAGALVERMTELYYDARFGGRDVSEAEVQPLLAEFERRLAGS